MSAEEPPDPLIGTTLDSRYRIDKLLGRGGMGAVYRGRHMMLDQVVAIKVLLPQLATDETATRRFVREAKSTFRFDHPHCVKVSDFGATPEGILYLVMEYLDGRTVDDELRIDGPMSGARTAHVLAQAADSLAYAHGFGLVHRDLKGENIMLIRRGSDYDFVKVLDFGLAKLWDADGGGLSRIMSVAALTADGMTFGTPHYMSPEQARGASLTPASDIYTLGVCGFEMLTGLLPFEHDNPVQVLTQIIVDEVPTPSSRRPDLAIPPALESLLMRCMAKDPGKRPASAATLAGELADLATALSRSSSSVPTQVAASETMELSQTAGQPAAEVSTPPGPAPTPSLPVQQ
ncbi:MAG: serine/threonine protein kinase, partial [Deltaproteobacteria bacterium]|nr:serine/threonine protein kinase [Deltaproteobacteria bacterium]